MALRKAFAESRLVEQADPAVDPVLVQRSFEIGVDGWLTMDVLPGIIRRSLDLVKLGERVFPSNAIMTYVAEGRCVASAPAASSKSTFSFHETQILR